MSLASVLERNKTLSLTETNRVVCLITGHEMPPKLDCVLQYLASSKFKKAKDWYSYDFSKYEPHIVKNSKNPKQLYCKLTKGMTLFFLRALI